MINISLLGRGHLSQLSVDRLETLKHLSQLALAHLEHHLLVLIVTLARLIILQVHLDVKRRLLHSVLLSRANLHIHPPVEVTHLGQ